MRAAWIAGGAGHDRRREAGMAARAALLALSGYKLLLSPLFTASCRFTPSCSTYMADAIREHGALRGGWLGARRLLRCHPFGGHGFDPVPPPRA
jgi:putative membrane protein insertion efficiency factor